MPTIYILAIATIILIIIAVIYTEKFDTYDLQYERAEKIFPDADRPQLRYAWSERDTNGSQLFDYVYEDLNRENNQITSYSTYDIPFPDSHVYAEFNGHTITLAQKNSP